MYRWQCGRGKCALQVHTSCALRCRHQGGAAVVSEGGDSFEAVSLLAILAKAVSCGRAEMVRSLLSLLPQEDSHDIAKFRDASGMGLLHLAVRSGSLGVLATLLEQCSADGWQVSGCRRSVYGHIIATHVCRLFCRHS